MPIITHDHYHQAPVEAKNTGVSKNALDVLGAELEAAFIVAKHRSEPPAKPPREMKADTRRVLAALVLKILRDLKVDTLPAITLSGAALADCPACGHPADAAWPFPKSGDSDPLQQTEDVTQPIQ